MGFVPFLFEEALKLGLVPCRFDRNQKQSRSINRLSFLTANYNPMSNAWDDWAADYPETMLTPWLPGVSNPIFDMIDAFGPHSIETCVDFGCGHGVLVKKLRHMFPKANVVGLDASQNMLNIARTSHPTCRFVWGDMVSLSAWYNQVDLATSTNSILPATTAEAVQMFREIAATVRHGGIFAGIVPSGDTIEHLMACAREAKMAAGLTETRARQEVEAYYVDLHGFDRVSGVYSDDPAGEHPQRIYWPKEIRILLQRLGFKYIMLEKVAYPWSACQKFGWGYFPWAERCWDWAFCAQKPY